MCAVRAALLHGVRDFGSRVGSVRKRGSSWPAGLLVLISMSACSSSEQIAFADCPVTTTTVPVPSEVRFERPVPWAREESGWFGSSDLWVSLPPDGILPTIVSEEDPDQFRTKFAWWRVSPGDLAVETRRPGADHAIEGSVPDGYGETGFNPSGLIFDGEGCWEVTGRVSEASLSFVVWVCETEFFPPVVSAAEREQCRAI